MRWISDYSLARVGFVVLLFALAGLCSQFVAAQPSSPDTMSPKQDEPLMAGEQGYVNDRSLQGIDSLPSGKITTLQDAEIYVERVAELCGVQGPTLRGELLLRLAKAEFAAAQDPSQLVSDDRIAEAFNFLSDQFQVPHPQRLSGADVLQFRTTMSAIYPNVFSPKSVSGSRPVQALITLHHLVFNGGVPEGAKKFAQKDPRPGSFKVDPSRTRAVLDKSPNLILREYRTASARYFQELTSEKMQSFVDSIAKIMAFPAGR